ncbi:MAG: hypothetical protein HUJ56_13330 [Erysipelotrichaceae bacterium]|nr:hypothetical protein [Erysipelotrichaceae bacterium]
MQIFNSDVLVKNQRFIKGLLGGSVAALGCAIIYGIISSLIGIEFSIAFVAIGYLIGEAIKRTGHGVKPEFSILGGVLTFISIFLADMIGMFGFGVFFSGMFFPCVKMYFASLLSTNINSLLRLLFRVAGVFEGYVNARIV